MTYYYVLWNTSEGPKYYRGTKQKAKDGFITVKYNDGSTSYFKEADIGSVDQNSGFIKVLTAEDWAANTLLEMSAEGAPRTNQDSQVASQSGSGKKRKRKTRKHKGRGKGGPKSKPTKSSVPVNRPRARRSSIFEKPQPLRYSTIHIVYDDLPGFAPQAWTFADYVDPRMMDKPGNAPLWNLKSKATHTLHNQGLTNAHWENLIVTKGGTEIGLHKVPGAHLTPAQEQAFNESNRESKVFDGQTVHVRMATASAGGGRRKRRKQRGGNTANCETAQLMYVDLANKEGKMLEVKVPNRWYMNDGPYKLVEYNVEDSEAQLYPPGIFGIGLETPDGREAFFIPQSDIDRGIVKLCEPSVDNDTAPAGGRRKKRRKTKKRKTRRKKRKTRRKKRN